MKFHVLPLFHASPMPSRGKYPCTFSAIKIPTATASAARWWLRTGSITSAIRPAVAAARRQELPHPYRLAAAVADRSAGHERHRSAVARAATGARAGEAGGRAGDDRAAGYRYHPPSLHPVFLVEPGARHSAGVAARYDEPKKRGFTVVNPTDCSRREISHADLPTRFTAGAG